MHAILRTTADASATDRSSRHQSSEIRRPSSPTLDDGATCSNCGAYVETIDTSEAVCPDCDIVVTTEPISTAPRPRYSGDEQNSKARSGSRFTLLYADRGLGVGIDGGATTDSTGSEISPTQKRVCRDKGWTKHLNPRDFRLDYALGEIRRMGGELNVPASEQERAARLFREAHDRGHVAGRSADGFAAASLLAAVRQSSLRLPVSEREIRTVTRATNEQLRTARGVLEVRMSVEVPPMKPRDFVPGATSALSSPWIVERCASALLDAYAADDDCRSISPRTLAAASLHAAYDITGTQERPSLEDLSRVTDVAVSTISERKSDVLAFRDAWESN